MPNRKHPSVFVACPYQPAKTYRNLVKALDRLPIEFHYADSAVETKYLLNRVRDYIAGTDFSFFDITGWNANVTLEFGLAEGLRKEYYILFKPGRGAKKEPPADLKGLQRFQYKRLDGFDPNCLTYKLNHQLLKKMPVPRHIYDGLPDYDSLSGPNRSKAFIVAMRILAHFKTSKILRRKELDALSKGSGLEKPAKNDLLSLLRSRGLLAGEPEGSQWKRRRKLYKNLRF